jgi:hypothetical protein
MCSHFPCSQIATIIAVYADWGFAAIKGIGWGWAGVIWLYNIVFYLPLDVIKFLIRYAMSGRAWDLVLDQRVRTHIPCTSWHPTFSFLAGGVLMFFLHGLPNADCLHEEEGFWAGRT